MDYLLSTWGSCEIVVKRIFLLSSSVHYNFCNVVSLNAEGIHRIHKGTGKFQYTNETVHLEHDRSARLQLAISEESCWFPDCVHVQLKRICR